MPDAKTWEDHWRDEHTPWDLGSFSPAIDELPDLLPLRNKRILVPGCGRGYDAFRLAQLGAKVTGLDLAPSARRPFHEAQKQFEPFETPPRLFIGDFFGDEWRAEASAVARTESAKTPDTDEFRFDLAWDYTFLCALPRHLLLSWADRYREILQPNAHIASLVFPIDPKKPRDDGPPYALDPEELIQAFDGRLRLIYRNPPRKSPPSRQGKEELMIWSIID
ncbi:MAG: TPMT family class I SAM-dependent methyltransferase [Polyangiaceae bacterium]|nr:TPMT family class I SAM-dependent methyltransferase [Polyangiaceae bacterium]